MRHVVVVAAGQPSGAKRRDQLLEKGMPHQQLDSVLAEFREQQMNVMAKKQGSVGEDEEAVPIVVLAVAREAGAIAAGSAVAREAGGLLPALQLQGRQSNMLSGTKMQV